MKLSASLILMTIALMAFATGIPAQNVRLKPLFSITGADLVNKLNMPCDVFVDDRHGEIYVVDGGNSRVVVFELDGFYKHRFTISSKSGGPGSLVVNSRGEILVTVGGRIAICDFRGSLLEYVDFRGFPYAEDVNAGRIRIDKHNNYYVVDAGRYRVLAFDSDWNFRFAIGRESLPRTGRNLTHTNEQEEPMVEALGIGDVCVDDEGMVYIVDPMASHVYVFSDEGEYERSIGQAGAAFASLSLPFGVAVDSQGRVLVTDSTGHGLLGYDKEGRFLFALGGMGSSPGRFYFPKRVSTDGNGRIYVVEPFLNRVQVLTTELRSAITEPPLSLTDTETGS